MARVSNSKEGSAPEKQASRAYSVACNIMGPRA